MEEYRNKVRKRVYVLAAGLLLCVIVIVAGSVIGGKTNGNIADFTRGFQAGLISGLISCFTVMIFFYAQSLKDEKKLQKMYISETDERNKLIYQKSGSVGINIIIVALALGSAVAGYFDMTVFFTLLCATIFASFVRAGLKIYYHFKY